jgi:hypothetical protein
MLGFQQLMHSMLRFVATFYIRFAFAASAFLQFCSEIDLQLTIDGATLFGHVLRWYAICSYENFLKQ